MSKRIEVKPGDRYGRLTVVEEVAPRIVHSGSRLRRYRMVRCQCACGNLVDASLVHLRNGGTASCGCLGKNNGTKHGKRHTPTYEIWKTMRQRCINPRSKRFDLYGGRGISVCDRWLNSFVNFLEDMGERPEECSIDRIDNDGNYEPGNCRWATRTQQARNTRKTRLITFDGHTRCLAEWAEIIGTTRSTLRNRLKRWPIEKALTSPPLPLHARRLGCPT